MSAVRERCGDTAATGISRLHGAYVEASIQADLCKIDLETALATGAGNADVARADLAAAQADARACRAQEASGAPWWVLPAAATAALLVGGGVGWALHP